MRIHLDTSDYGAMHVAPQGTDIACIRETLKTMARNGQVEIGLSYHIIFEFLQKAGPGYREDRLARARLLKELCGQNAFPYGRDLGKGHVFSKEGIWVPRFSLEEFEVERLVYDLLKQMARNPYSRASKGAVYPSARTLKLIYAASRRSSSSGRARSGGCRTGASSSKAATSGATSLGRFLGRRQTGSCGCT